jgi:hypothetical protein
VPDGWSRIRDEEIGYIQYVRLDTVDKHVVSIGYGRIDCLKSVHTRESGRHKEVVKDRSCASMRTSLLTTRIPKTIWQRYVMT